MPENILDTIIAYKRGEVQKAKAAVSARELEKKIHFGRKVLSLKSSLDNESRTGIIAEFKRRSPSKGTFNADANAEVITRAYAEGGASGLSVLTDSNFFGGSAQDLEEARVNEIPILRKDFMLDEYQLIEAKSMGADVILLIAACLTSDQTRALAMFAHTLDLEVILEIHQDSELSHICDEIDIVGVNNRDLKTFTVDINRSLDLGKKIPADKCKISESGISDVASINLLKEHGYNGFLIGETFMKEQNPAVAFARFVHQLNGD